MFINFLDNSDNKFKYFSSLSDKFFIILGFCGLKNIEQKTLAPWIYMMVTEIFPQKKLGFKNKWNLFYLSRLNYFIEWFVKIIFLLNFIYF